VVEGEPIGKESKNTMTESSRLKKMRTVGRTLRRSVTLGKEFRREPQLRELAKPKKRIVLNISQYIATTPKPEETGRLAKWFHSLSWRPGRQLGREQSAWTQAIRGRLAISRGPIVYLIDDPRISFWQYGVSRHEMPICLTEEEPLTPKCRWERCES